MVFRVFKNKNYTVMSNYHLRDKELSLKAKGLLSWMLSNDDDWDYSIKGIVANCKENETAIESALAELKDRGYVHVTKLMPNQTKSGRIEYVYDILEEPKQGGDFLPLENQVVENPVQRSTNRRSTKERSNTIPKGIVTEVTTEENDTDTSDSLKDSISEYESKMYSEDRRKIRKIDTEQPKKKKMSLWDKCVQIINEFTDDEKLRSVLTEFLKMRLSIKDKVMYAPQWKAMLERMSLLKGDPVRIVSQSLEHGWAGFYDEKPVYSGGYKKKSVYEVTSEHANMNSNKVTQEEWEEMQKNGEVY